MKKLICILAGAALLGACEQKTDVVAPASTPAPSADKPDASLTGQKPKRDTTATLSVAGTPAVTTETKTESTETTTATTPNP